MIKDFMLRRRDEVWCNYRDAVDTLLLRHACETHRLSRGLRACACKHGNPAAYMLHGGGDYRLLLALIQGVELTIGAENEDAVNPAIDEMIEKPSQPGQVQVLIGLHRCGNRRYDAADLHVNPP